MDLFFYITLLLSILTTSIVAGTVFAYGNSVMPGLNTTDDRTFVLAVRKLNSSVDNPIFLLVSNIALLAQIILVFLGYLTNSESIFVCLIALIGYVATLLITFFGNLPLNRTIISSELPVEDLGWNTLRVNFESRWIFFNHLRTGTCLLSLVTLLVVMLLELF